MPTSFLGNAVTDTATLSGTATQPANPVINLTGTGGAAAGGTITFKLYGPGNCTTLACTSAAVAVSGNGTYNTPAPQFVPTAAGTYHWVAVVQRRTRPTTTATTHNAACTDANEDVVVTHRASSMTTAQTGCRTTRRRSRAPAGGRPGRHSLVRAVRLERLHAGTAIYSDHRTVAGASPQTCATASTHAAQPATGSVLVVGELRQHQPGPAGHPRQLPRDVGLTITNGGTISSP